MAYQCPQCGASVEVPDRGSSVACSYCDVSIRVEGRVEATPAPGRRPREPREAKDAYRPPREATLTTSTFGRFDVAVLRQAIHPSPREAMRWLPLDERRAGLFLLRVVEEESRRGRRLRCEEAVLAALAESARESLRERADPGLAAKAALSALERSGAEGLLEAFVAVFDADKSRVETYNAGCKAGLILCSIEEGRQIDVTRDRGLLKRLDLRGKQDAFANGRAVELAADDAVVVTSAALAGEGRGWAYGQRSTYETLKRVWPGRTSAELAVAVKDGFWDGHERSSSRSEQPTGDLLVVAVNVRSNLDLVGEVDVDLPPARTFQTERFDLALAPSEDAFLELRPIAEGEQMLAWVEGLPASEAAAKGRVFSDAAFEVMSRVAGNHDRPQDGGREGAQAAGFEGTTARALVLYLGEQHGKLAFYTLGWPPGFALAPRGSRSGTLQQFGAGGEAWPKPGGRLVFPGGLPFEGTIARLSDLPAAWPGGKASALYATCQQHEDLATSEAFLQAVLRSARADSSEGSFLGALVVTARRP